MLQDSTIALLLLTDLQINLKCIKLPNERCDLILYADVRPSETGSEENKRVKGFDSLLQHEKHSRDITLPADPKQKWFSKAADKEVASLSRACFHVWRVSCC